MNSVNDTVKATETWGGSIRQTVIDINQTTEVFIDTYHSLRPNVIAWVHWFITS